MKLEAHVNFVWGSGEKLSEWIELNICNASDVKARFWQKEKKKEKACLHSHGHRHGRDAVIKLQNDFVWWMKKMHRYNNPPERKLCFFSAVFNSFSLQEEPRLSAWLMPSLLIYCMIISEKPSKGITALRSAPCSSEPDPLAAHVLQ